MLILRQFNFLRKGDANENGIAAKLEILGALCG